MFGTTLRKLKKMASKISRSRFGYSPLITITVSKTALLHNLHELQKLSPQVAPVLKSNAYGHGLVEIAEMLDSQNCPFLIVDSYFEALALRRSGIVSPLLIIGYTPIPTIIKNRLKKVAFTIISMDALAELTATVEKKQSSHKTTIHLKIDTGMNRQGIRTEEVAQAIDLLYRENIQGKIVLEGMLTHFSDADNMDDAFTRKQIELWNALVKKMSSVRYLHIANSAGHAYVKDAIANVSRAGMTLYGISANGPIDSLLDLKPVLEMKTIISGVKKIPKGSEVGYGRTFIAPSDMTIATIPVGYFEGVDRRLSNKGVVKVDGVFAPIIGRVSMNITTIDVSRVATVHRDQEVTVISRIPSDKNSVETIANECGTIPYEILTALPSHLRREVVVNKL